MKLIKLLSFSIILFGLFTTACSSSKSSGCSEVEQDQKQSELSAVQTVLYDAELAYYADNSQENCDAYTDAWDAYLVKLRAFVDCLEGPAKTSWEQVYAIQVQDRNAFSC